MSVVVVVVVVVVLEVAVVVVVVMDVVGLARGCCSFVMVVWMVGCGSCTDGAVESVVDGVWYRCGCGCCGRLRLFWLKLLVKL